MKTGEERWKYKHKSGSLMWAATDNGTLVVTGGDGRAIAFAAESGEVLWTTELGGECYFQPSIVDGHAIIGTMEEKVISIDMKTGNIAWEIEVEGDLESAGVVSNGVLHLGTRSAVVYAIDVKTGDVLWSNKEKRPRKRTTVFSNFVISGDAIYYGTWDERIVSVDVKSGQQLREFSAGGRLPSLAANDHTLVYSLFRNSTLTAVAQ